MAEKGSTQRRRGRPPLKPGTPKRSSFNTRLRSKLKERLEAEAQEAGRSLSEEIEFRLEQSFRDEDTFGGAPMASLFRLLAAAAQIIENDTGKSRDDDWDTYMITNEAWRALISASSPPVPDEIRDEANPDHIIDRYEELWKRGKVVSLDLRRGRGRLSHQQRLKIAAEQIDLEKT